MPVAIDDPAHPLNYETDYARRAKNRPCSVCGKNTCMAKIVRNSVYPYVHWIFKCSKCLKREEQEVKP